MVSVVGVMVIGVLAGYWLHINRKTSYLISSGTAICGGSAIAAVGPVLKADDHEMAVSLGVVFVLNAIALFIFPPIGAYFDMSAAQFGTWAAIAIHDTSSVVGAGDAYSGMLAAQGVENAGDALKLATLIKLTRALWIIPLALVTMLIFRDKKSKISIPWFIFLFILAMVINTYLPLPAWLTSTGISCQEGSCAHSVHDRSRTIGQDGQGCGCEAVCARNHAVDHHRCEQLLCGDEHYRLSLGSGISARINHIHNQSPHFLLSFTCHARYIPCCRLQWRS